MDKWNIVEDPAFCGGMMGLKDWGFLYKCSNLMMIVAISTKFVSDPTFFVAQYSIIPPFHHSYASASGYGI